MFTVGSISAYLGLLTFVYISVLLTIIDIRTRRLPDRIVIPSGVVVISFLTLSRIATSFSQHAAGKTDSTLLLPHLAQPISGAVCAFMLFYLLAIISPQGMGGGDVKLAPIIGAFLGYFAGWPGVILGLATGFVIGAGWSIVVLLLRGKNQNTTIPFGPCMFAGAWGALFLFTIIGVELQ